MISVQHTTTEDGILVFNVDGELKIASAEDCKNEINATIDNAKANKVVLDLGNLTFLDSAGLAVFISAYKKLALIGGKLAICSVQGQPKTIIEISNLQKIISIYPTRDEAIKAK